MTKAEFQTLVDELIGRGMTRTTAERIARKRRKAASPAHKAAAARRWALAQEAREGRAAMDALRAGI